MISNAVRRKYNLAIGIAQNFIQQYTSFFQGKFRVQVFPLAPLQETGGLGRAPIVSVVS